VNDATIRRPRSEELGAMVALWERSVRATHGFVSNEDIELFRPLVERGLGDVAADVWVVVSAEDTILGFLAMAEDRIDALFLEPDRRRRGLGSRLVAHAQELSGDALAVDVNEQNAEARAFYQELGFEVIGRSPLDDTGRPYPVLHLRRMSPMATPSSGARSDSRRDPRR
jgi:putative acetyltransferase